MEALKSSSCCRWKRKFRKDTLVDTYLVEIEVHGAKVDLQLSRVLLLLQKLLLSLSLLLGFALLELFLGLSGFALLLFVVFFF